MNSLAGAMAILAAFGLQTRPMEGDLRPGDKAPDFELKTLGAKSKFKLSSNFGKKPTVLIFGSYT